MNAPIRHNQLKPNLARPHSLTMLLRLLKRLRHGALLVRLPDGKVQHISGSRPGTQAELHIHDARFAKLVMRRAEVGLGEAYRDGWFTTPDLTKLLLLAIENQAALKDLFYANRLVTSIMRVSHWLRANTRRGSRKNIAAHYDLSNDFYGRWLDSTMTYSAALFAGNSNRTLLAAQEEKYQRIVDTLEIGPDHHVLEVGCGWGGFAEYVATKTGARVTAVTISPAQFDYAQRRISAAGLSDRVNITLCDYRDLTGDFDRIVSIEMFEAVGERFWPTFFSTLRSRLRPTGRAIIQTITIADELFAEYRSRVDFIQRYIFPGGMLPSVARFRQEVERRGLSVIGQFGFGGDYAETLRRWRLRFSQQAAELETLGFPPSFQRLWQFYFCYCEAGFATTRTDVVQFVLSHEGA